MPYKGSKSEIVKELIDNLPPGDHFYDLFGGGGSVAQYALLSGKYKYILTLSLKRVLYYVRYK